MANQQSTPRLPYEPPRIRKIKIIPEELAAAACKKVRVSNHVCRIGGSQLVNRLIGS